MSLRITRFPISGLTKIKISYFLTKAETISTVVAGQFTGINLPFYNLFVKALKLINV
jgi:hypothetical protein